MHTTVQFRRRREAIGRLLKMHLQNYPEHVIAQAIREAWKVLAIEHHSARQAIMAGKRHAQARMRDACESAAKRADTAASA